MGIKLQGGAAFLIAALLTLPAHAEPINRKFELDGVKFEVTTPNDGSINQLTISIEGLRHDVEPIVREIEGTVTGVEVADIDRNGSPEIYVYVTGAGSGSYGSLVALAVNNRKSVSDIYLPALTDDKKLSAGYMGHDEFAVVESNLSRRFPVYKPGDMNARPTGGMRQIAYKLVPGEAGWKLKVKRVDNF